MKISIKKNNFVFLFAMLLGICSSISSAHALDTFEERAQEIIDVVAAMDIYHDGQEKHGGTSAAAKFFKGDDAGAINDLDAAVSTNNHNMFTYHEIMGCYVHYKDRIPDWLREKVKDYYCDFSVWDDDKNRPDGYTENHHLMYACAAFLAGEAWPSDFPSSDFNKFTDWLNNTFNNRVKRGYWEHDSNNYFAHHLGPILDLAQFANDPAMRQKALMVYEWYLATAIGEVTEGANWLSSSSRYTRPAGAGIISPMWLYLGGNYAPHLHSWNDQIHWKEMIFFAVGDYRLPPIMHNIGTDRSTPYIHREHMTGGGGNPYKTAYVTKSYGLFSQHDTWSYSQLHRWAVKWDVDALDEEPCVFFIKPPHDDRAGYYKTSDPFEGRRYWEGATSYEQTLQDEGTLLTVTNISGPNQWITAPISKTGYKAMLEQDGWIFLHAGHVLIACYLSNPYYWDGEMYVDEGPDIFADIIRSDGEKHGIIVETAPIAAYSGGSDMDELNAFKAEILNTTMVDDSHLNDANPRLIYTNLKGNTLDITWNGSHRVNGSAISYSNWDLIDNPFMHQALYDRYLEMNYNGDTRIYDFDNWTISGDDPTPPPPPAIETGKWYRLKNLQYNKYLDTQPNRVLRIEPKGTSDGATWQFEDAGDGYYYIDAKRAGRGYLDTSSNYVVSWKDFNTADGRKWLPIALDDGTFRFRNKKSGREYLVADSDDSIKWNDGQTGADTQWVLIEVE